MSENRNEISNSELDDLILKLDGIINSGDDAPGLKLQRAQTCISEAPEQYRSELSEFLYVIVLMRAKNAGLARAKNVDDKVPSSELQELTLKLDSIICDTEDELDVRIQRAQECISGAPTECRRTLSFRLRLMIALTKDPFPSDVAQKKDD